MNEIALQLNELNEDRFEQLARPDLDAITEVEEQLLIGLPIEFKEFLMDVSHVLYRDIEPVTITDPNLHSYLPEVASVAWDRGVPRELVPICEYNGDYYCISQESEIVFWQRGELTENTWDSIWDWVSDVWLNVENE